MVQDRSELGMTAAGDGDGFERAVDDVTCLEQVLAGASALERRRFSQLQVVQLSVPALD